MSKNDENKLLEYKDALTDVYIDEVEFSMWPHTYEYFRDIIDKNIFAGKTVDECKQIANRALRCVLKLRRICPNYKYYLLSDFFLGRVPGKLDNINKRLEILEAETYKQELAIKIKDKVKDSRKANMLINYASRRLNGKTLDECKKIGGEIFEKIKNSNNIKIDYYIEILDDNLNIDEVLKDSRVRGIKMDTKNYDNNKNKYEVSDYFLSNIPGYVVNSDSGEHVRLHSGWLLDLDGDLKKKVKLVAVQTTVVNGKEKKKEFELNITGKMDDDKIKDHRDVGDYLKYFKDNDDEIDDDKKGSKEHKNKRKEEVDEDEYDEYDDDEIDDDDTKSSKKNKDKYGKEKNSKRRAKVKKMNDIEKSTKHRVKVSGKSKNKSGRDDGEDIDDDDGSNKKKNDKGITFGAEGRTKMKDPKDKDPKDKDPKDKDPKDKDPKDKDPKDKDPKDKDPKDKDPKGKDPNSKDPKGKDPKGKDPKGKDPKGKDPKGKDPKGKGDKYPDDSNKPDPTKPDPNGLNQPGPNDINQNNNLTKVALETKCFNATVYTSITVKDTEKDTKKLAAVMQLAVANGKQKELLNAFEKAGFKVDYTSNNIEQGDKSINDAVKVAKKFKQEQGFHYKNNENTLNLKDGAVTEYVGNQDTIKNGIEKQIEEINSMSDSNQKDSYNNARVSELSEAANKYGVQSAQFSESVPNLAMNKLKLSIVKKALSKSQNEINDKKLNVDTR